MATLTLVTPVWVEEDTAKLWKESKIDQFGGVVMFSYVCFGLIVIHYACCCVNEGEKQRSPECHPTFCWDIRCCGGRKAVPNLSAD